MNVLQGAMGAIGISAVAGALSLLFLITSILNPPTQMALTTVPGGTFTCAGASPCVNPSANGVVQAAMSMAPHLQMCRNADDPAGYEWDKCYDAGMPKAAIAYWTSVCPPGTGCYPYWQSGNLQCVEFVTAAYAMGGDPLPKAGNAIDFWNLYRNLDGWTELAVNQAYNYTNSPPSLPEPGDLAVWYNENAPDLGHIALVVAVTPPQGKLLGSFSYAEANGPAPVMVNTIYPDDSVANMPNFFLIGYIRHVGGGTRPLAAGEHDFVCALLPFARKAQADMQLGPHAIQHPWYISVILAQWGVEQGWRTPGYTGYNFGNVSAYPGFPSIGGTGQPGSPGAFAYGQTAEQGVDEYVTFTQMALYQSVAAAYPAGALSQAQALGQSPWDAGHYDNGYPGKKLVDAITTYQLTRFDAPNAAC